MPVAEPDDRLVPTTEFWVIDLGEMPRWWWQRYRCLRRIVATRRLALRLALIRPDGHAVPHI